MSWRPDILESRAFTKDSIPGKLFRVSNPLQSRKQDRLVSLEKWRKDTESDARQSQDQFDKALMTLSAGGIGITIAFLDKIVPFPEASLKWLLFLIWFLWGLCLLATVFSFYASNRGLSRSERQIAEEIEAVSKAHDSDAVPGPKNDGGSWNTATKILNEAAAVLFLLGLFAMLIFIWYNLFMTTPKLPLKQSDGGQIAATRPPLTTPNTKGLTSSERPTGSGPTPTSGSNSSDGATPPSGGTKK